MNTCTQIASNTVRLSEIVPGYCARKLMFAQKALFFVRIDGCMHNCCAHKPGIAQICNNIVRGHKENIINNN
jgi:hypothetical protein